MGFFDDLGAFIVGLRDPRTPQGLFVVATKPIVDKAGEIALPIIDAAVPLVAAPIRAVQADILEERARGDEALAKRVESINKTVAAKLRADAEEERAIAGDARAAGGEDLAWGVGTIAFGAATRVAVAGGKQVLKVAGNALAKQTAQRSVRGAATARVAAAAADEEVSMAAGAAALDAEATGALSQAAEKAAMAERRAARAELKLGAAERKLARRMNVTRSTRAANTRAKWRKMSAIEKARHGARAVRREAWRTVKPGVEFNPLDFGFRYGMYMLGDMPELPEFELPPPPPTDEPPPGPEDKKEPQATEPVFTTFAPPVDDGEEGSVEVFFNDGDDGVPVLTIVAAGAVLLAATWLWKRRSSE